MKLFLLFLLFFAIQCPLIFAENIFNIGHFRSSDKTGKICTPTIDGWKITIPPGKEGHHYFYWQNRKPLCFPANTPVKIGAWFRTFEVAGTAKKSPQLGIRLGLSNRKGVTKYMWATGYPTTQWRYIENVAKWDTELNRCTQNLFIAYNCSGSIWYDDIYFGSYTNTDKINEARGIIVTPEGSPLVDGFIEKEKWDLAPILSNFRTSKVRGEQPANDKTEFRLLADDKNLYIAVKANSLFLDPALQQLDKFKLVATKNGPAVLSDDSVEIFLKDSKNKLVQLGLNAKGFQYSGNGEGKSINFPWFCKTKIDKGFWSAEIAIPWESLGYQAKPLTPILFNLGRNSFGKKGVTYSSWTPFNYMYKEEDVFGKILFKNSIPSIQISEIPNTIDSNFVSVNITLLSNNSWKGKLSLELKDNKVHTRELAQIALIPKKETKVTLTSKLAHAMPSQVRLVLQDPAGNILFRSPWKKVVSTRSYLALNNIAGDTLIVNGEKVLPKKTFSLKTGKNILQFCKNNSKGHITILKSKENITLQPGQKLILAVNSTSIKCLDTTQGLHIEKGASQHIPFLIEEPYEKTLEILVPAPLKIISYPKNSPFCIEKKDIILNKEKYVQHIVKSKAKLNAKQHILGYLIELPLNSPNQIPPIKFRTLHKNYIELYQELPIKVMEPFIGKKPNTLRLTMFDSFNYGDISETDAIAFVKTLAKSGINVFVDRKSVYTRTKGLPWVKAVQASGIKLNCELHNKAILGNPKKIRSLSNKGHSYLAAPVSYITGAGKKETIGKIQKFISEVQPDEVCFDMECSPDIEFDTSKEGLKRFATFAKLDKTPNIQDIKQGGKLRKQWVDFCCKEIARYTSVLKEGTKLGKPNCKFMVYSAYQSPTNKNSYSIDWNYFNGIADIGSCGYGFPTEEITKSTISAAGKIPFESGELIYQSNHASLNNLTNSIIRRILQGYTGVMFYDASVIDGFVRKKIASAANILSQHETYFLKKQSSKNFTISGNLLLKDSWMLTNNSKKLFIYLNNTSDTRSGIVNINNKKIPVKVNPYGQFHILVP